MKERKVEIFLSYCWEDEKIADKIYDNLIRRVQINLHRDKLDIRQWKSIREYMQSITYMDYIILLISEAYLKSSNCMYEVLEVMRDREYKDKIFPAIIYSEIYDPSTKADFIIYWQDELKALKKKVKGINRQNLGSLINDLNHRQNIASNISDFLDLISDMNNPEINDVSDAIEKKLLEKGLITKEKNLEDFSVQNQNLFAKLDINNCQEKTVVTYLDINQFMADSYYKIQQILKELYQQLSVAEMEELLYLKTEKNYAAHPIVNIDNKNTNKQLELEMIAKEETKDLIRKAFEIIFLKDAIIAKKFIEDFCSNLAHFYDKVETDGLKDFLNNRYFCQMTQESKDQLFSSLWKLVFVANDTECNKNRESNYWGLVFLYDENREHYRKLIKNNENHYSNELELETIEWSKENSNDGKEERIISFKKVSRIIHLIRFLEYFPEIYKELNDIARGNLQESINHMYIKVNIKQEPLYLIKAPERLVKEQIKIKATTLFLSKDANKHFEMIFRMINNYRQIDHNLIDFYHHDVLDIQDLEVIFHQCECQGYIEEFIKFLIDYCIGVETYLSAATLFKYILNYKKYLKKEHYYMILAKMECNSQFSENRDKSIFRNEMEKMFLESFNENLIREEQEKVLYYKLYDFSIRNRNKQYNLKKILSLIEERAEYYTAWYLHFLTEMLLNNSQDTKFFEEENPLQYNNILKVLSAFNANYDAEFKKHFNKYK